MATYLSYHTFKRLSRVFFKTFFEPRFRPVGIIQVRIRSESRCSCGFRLTLCCSPVRQLCYNTTFPLLCQHLFSNFFPFLQTVLLSLSFLTFTSLCNLQFVFFGCFLVKYLYFAPAASRRSRFAACSTHTAVSTAAESKPASVKESFCKAPLMHLLLRAASCR